MFGRKKKGKKSSPDTRGLSDYHPQPYINISAPPASSPFVEAPYPVPSAPAALNPFVVVPYPVSSAPASSVEPPFCLPMAAPYEPPQQAATLSNNLPVPTMSRPKISIGGNMNKKGVQEVGKVDVDISNSHASEIPDLDVGNNTNEDVKQTIDEVKFKSGAQPDP